MHNIARVRKAGLSNCLTSVNVYDAVAWMSRRAVHRQPKAGGQMQHNGWHALLA